MNKKAKREDGKRGTKRRWFAGNESKEAETKKGKKDLPWWTKGRAGGLK